MISIGDTQGMVKSIYGVGVTSNVLSYLTNFNSFIVHLEIILKTREKYI